MPANSRILFVLGGEDWGFAGMTTPTVCPGSLGWVVKWWERQQLRVGGSLSSQCCCPYNDSAHSHLPMGKLRLREVRSLAEGHLAGKCQSWDLNLSKTRAYAPSTAVCLTGKPSDCDPGSALTSLCALRKPVYLVNLNNHL